MLAALGRGWHVVCEKPFLIDAAALARARACSHDRRLAVVPVHNWKHAPIVRDATARLRRGAIGRLERVDIEVERLRDCRGADPVRPNWRRDAAVAGGGILMDHGWHAVYLALHWFGDRPHAVDANFSRPDPDAVETEADVRLSFARGETSIRLSWNGTARRNAMHLVGGSNDYRSVDIAFPTPPRPDDEETGDAWLGVYKSFDGGNRWVSNLLDGYPQQNNLSSPLNGFQAAADPVVRAANNGLFYYAGIVLNRGTNPLSAVFMARFIDRNNVEAGDPIAFLGTKVIDKGSSGQFIDKPWIAVAPMTNGGQCTVDGQTFAAQNVYLAYSILVGNDNNIRTKIMFTRSTDCGNTWAAPQKLSETFSINQGVNIAVDPSNGNNVYVVWRRFAGGNDPNSIVVAKSANAGGTFTKGLVVGNIAQPFDQITKGAEIRTNAYPTVAVDNSGRVYVAFSQRNAAGDATVNITTSADGFTNWSVLAAVAPIVGGTSNGRGHQFMPSMMFAAGKLTLVWYDLQRCRNRSPCGACNPIPRTPKAARLLETFSWDSRKSCSGRACRTPRRLARRCLWSAVTRSTSMRPSRSCSADLNSWRSRQRRA